MIINKTETGYRLEHRGMEVEFLRSRHVVESFACMALDQLIVDAERYRFLREVNARPFEDGDLFVGWDSDDGGDWVGCDLDRAIDIAMAAESSKTGADNEA